MMVTKRDIRNHGQVVLDQNGNLNVKDANIRGDLRVHGKLIQVQAQPAQPVQQAPFHEEVIIYHPMKTVHCELMIQNQEEQTIKDNEPFVWSVMTDDSQMFDGVSSVKIPMSGVYSVVSRVYNADVDCVGSGTSLWINGNYTYASVNAREGDHTSSMSNIRPFKEGDTLMLKSVLNTLLLSNHKQCYTFQITKLC